MHFLQKHKIIFIPTFVIIAESWNMDHYQNLSIDYETLQPKGEILKQESFFKKLVKNYAIKTCLDCACGTGWHLFMLHQSGLQCTGSDLSDQMLKKARENLKDLSIPLKKVDFRNLNKKWESSFDMIICMSTSFPHNQNNKDAVQTLNAMFDCLKDGGIAVIDNGFSDAFFKAKPRFIPARIHKDQAYYFFLEYPNPEKVIFNILHIKKTSEGFDHLFESIDYMAIKKKEFDHFFEQTAFSKVEYFGGFDFTEYDEASSQRTIVIAQK